MNLANVSDTRFDYLLPVVEEILDQHPLGLPEFEFLKLLEQQRIEPFINRPNHDLHGLFKIHFILFHSLYRLRDRLEKLNGVSLDIHCLCIKKVKKFKGRGHFPELLDHLRSYYIDLKNLDETSSEDVSNLFGDFWSKFSKTERREKAIKVLNLSEPFTVGEAKKQYRRMVMKHHPDRGGSKSRIQLLNEAMDIIESTAR